MWIEIWNDLSLVDNIHLGHHLPPGCHCLHRSTLPPSPLSPDQFFPDPLYPWSRIGNWMHPGTWRHLDGTWMHPGTWRHPDGTPDYGRRCNCSASIGVGRTFRRNTGSPAPGTEGSIRTRRSDAGRSLDCCGKSSDSWWNGLIHYSSLFIIRLLLSWYNPILTRSTTILSSVWCPNYVNTLVIRSTTTTWVWCPDYVNNSLVRQRKIHGQ